MAVAAELIQAFADAAERSESEFELALLVAAFVDPEVQAEAVHNALQDVVQGMPSAPPGAPHELLTGLLAQGYGQHALQQVTLQHSHIGWALQQKQGLPIALAVVLIECARRCGFNSYGINFPGHFLVQVGEELVDPLRMQAVSAEQLKGSGLTDTELVQMLQPCTAQALGLRMLNNLKSVFVSQQNWQQALDLLDCQLALARTDTEMVALLHFERGEMWEQVGAVRVAKDAYQACLTATASAEVANKANARIAGLDGLNETLH